MTPKKTLRDEFAMSVLNGLLSYSHLHPQQGNYHENCTPAQAVATAYAYADLMLACRMIDGKEDTR